METLGYFGWCLIPLFFFGLMAVACMFMGARRGGCACHSAMRSPDREPPQTPRVPGAV
jgi:hypothetical protein